jgi:hypothetical protein
VLAEPVAPDEDGVEDAADPEEPEEADTVGGAASGDPVFPEVAQALSARVAANERSTTVADF